jgi:hypothetical protein
VLYYVGHIYDYLDMVMILIDPIAALDGLQNAISMVKKASKVANDLLVIGSFIVFMFVSMI